MLDLIAELGLDGVSMMFMEGLADRSPGDVAADPERWADRIGAQLADRGLAVADVFLNPSPDLERLAVNHPDPDERAAGDELFERFLTFAGRLGSSGMTTLPGLVYGAEPWEDALERSAGALRRRVAAAGERGLRLSVEPHIVSTSPYRGSVIDAPARVQELLARVPGLE